MQRKALLVSFGMLIEKVDFQIFMGLMFVAAKQANPAFQFTPQILGGGFMLSEQLNQKKMTREDFKTKLLGLLGIPTMDEVQFWKAWDAMLTIGNINANTSYLQSLSSEHNTQTYISSDTNFSHFNKLERGLASEGVTIARSVSDNRLHYLQGMPLYATFEFGMGRSELVKHVVMEEIKKKTFNKPEEIVLILGDPQNITDKNFQALAKKECDALSAWCAENGVRVVLHTKPNTLQQTIDNALGIERELVAAPVMASV